ncbi:CHAT domain-containing protein [Calothrix sp. PCC 7507]|uniref:CHAT domain-containing protein n=1 Tax=Calothrix sp. PCC 7507 TaxID=99598 RepID=UPI00029F13F7|nr:CHAT domain-containing protein [Calothrix sp. PCC 7507]AFY34969.1 TPR repeat-containing protein [Calothrix sp. PCC 7507]
MNELVRFGWLDFIPVPRRRVIRLVCCFLMALLCILGSPVLAKVPGINSASELAINNVDAASLLQQGKVLYDAGRFAEAVRILQQAVQEYQKQGDTVNHAVTLSNLSLGYQQLGAWSEAKQAITESLNLLKGEKNSQNIQIYAKSLDILGRLQLAMGQPEVALTTWQQAAEIYQRSQNYNGVVKTLINQAQAWRSQGFYYRSQEILKEVNQQLQSQPDSIAKAVAWRSLGDTLLVAGDLKESRMALEQSLIIAQRLQSSAEIGESLFSLGNNARIQQQKSQAQAYYQQAVKASPSPLIKVQAQLNHFSLLIADQKLAEAQTLLPLIQSQLEQLPPSRPTIYAHINFAQSLKKLPSYSLQPARLLATAIQQARDLDDKKAEAYGLGSLGGLYESTQQWPEAQNLTQKALVLAQTSNALDIVYPLDWQLGRLLWAQKNLDGAIAAYDGAVETLQFLRRDLAAINQDVQFNFRDSVEPVYRQSVELLLQSQTIKPQDKTLDKARQRIEALQLAELDNFFREACLLGQSVSLDKVVDQENPHTAILYPIILPEQIQVIVKIPHKPLRHYSTKISQAEVEKTLTQLQKHLVNPASIIAIKKESQQVYNWLIKPIESELPASQVNTLVFVLDGLLRNLPMASLYDGKQYLVEKYAIALSVGLQLLDPKPLLRQQIRALTAGLSQPPAEFSDLTFLAAVKSEVNLITQAGVLTTSLLDEQFTRKALEQKVNTIPFNVVHLATHGQFSSKAEKTFILAADGPINVKQFDSLFSSRDKIKPEAIELLFLSACQTAAGDNRAALGLAGAAVRAGARSTLASLWHIDDEFTALFVGAFYQDLKGSTVTKAEALRHAQLKLLQHPNYNSPSFWSAYVLIGNWL